MGSETRGNEIRALKARFISFDKTKALCNDDLSTATFISFKIAHRLGQHKKSFSDGENVKEMTIDILEAMFKNTDLEDRVLKFANAVPLSRRTIVRRTQSISANLRSQLLIDLSNCHYFSVQLDESTDCSGHAQVAVFFRMIFADLIIKDEFFTLFSLKKHIKEISSLIQ